MRRLARCGWAVFLLAVLGGCGRAPDLSGKWEVVRDGAFGQGEEFAFDADGSFQQANPFGYDQRPAKAQGRYSYPDRGHLQLDCPALAEHGPLLFAVTTADDRVTLRDADGATTVLQRYGTVPPSAEALAGEWYGPPVRGVTWFFLASRESREGGRDVMTGSGDRPKNITFNADGTFDAKGDSVSASGSYTVEGDTLHVVALPLIETPDLRAWGLAPPARQESKLDIVELTPAKLRLKTPRDTQGWPDARGGEEVLLHRANRDDG